MWLLWLLTTCCIISQMINSFPNILYHIIWYLYEYVTGRISLIYHICIRRYDTSWYKWCLLDGALSPKVRMITQFGHRILTYFGGISCVKKDESILAHRSQKIWLVRAYVTFVTFDKMSHYFTNDQFLSKYIVSHNMVFIWVCNGLNIFELSHLYQKIWHKLVLVMLTRWCIISYYMNAKCILNIEF